MGATRPPDDSTHQLRELVRAARFGEALDWFRRAEGLPGAGRPARPVVEAAIRGLTRPHTTPTKSRISVKAFAEVLAGPIIAPRSSDHPALLKRTPHGQRRFSRVLDTRSL